MIRTVIVGIIKAKDKNLIITTRVEIIMVVAVDTIVALEVIKIDSLITAHMDINIIISNLPIIIHMVIGVIITIAITSSNNSRIMSSITTITTLITIYTILVLLLLVKITIISNKIINTNRITGIKVRDTKVITIVIRVRDINNTITRVVHIKIININLINNTKATNKDLKIIIF